MLDVPASESAAGTATAVIFERGDRGRLYVGARHLSAYLEVGGMRWVLKLAQSMKAFDWSAFEASYKPGGRPPLHPMLVVGLVMYGLLLKQSSLRQLEQLALRDVGAWWMTGGLTPDHTTIARFLRRHRDLLSEDFFIQVTKHVAQQLGMKAGDLALDGTVVQAVASSASSLKREALAKELQEAKDANEEERVEQLQKASVALERRAETREAAGKSSEHLEVAVTEPEAVVQPQKNSSDFKPSYKPVIGANEFGLITGQALSPSSEPACVPEVLVQHGQIFEAAPTRGMADSAFSGIETLAIMASIDVEALIPSGQRGGEKRTPKGIFPKSAFVYDAPSDTMHCPGNATLTPGKWQTHYTGQRFRAFTTASCTHCPLKAQCTRTRYRQVKRFEGDELKEKARRLLAERAAADAYRRRAAMVEPAISRLRQGGLERFTRRGQLGARLELSLRCSAHNLALLLRRIGSFFVAIGLIRGPDGEWRCFEIAVGTIAPNRC